MPVARGGLDYFLTMKGLLIPNIGDTIRGLTIGKTRDSLFVWQACIKCGNQRWVITSKGKPLFNMCFPCSRGNRAGKVYVPTLGTRKLTAEGYYTISVGPDDFYFPMGFSIGRKGTGVAVRVLEHRLVMAKSLGRCLQPWELVHHKNGIKDDNRVENLELGTRGSHVIGHSKGYREGYTKGLQDGRDKQIAELKSLIEEQMKQIKLLQWQIREKITIS